MCEDCKGAISEYWPAKIVFALIPPFICVGQYFVSGTMLLVFVLSGFHLVWGLFAAPLALISLIMLRFWYRTFFDSDYVGPDFLVSVKWSADMIHFRGAYFNIEVPIQKVIGYRVVGFQQFNKTFIVVVKVEYPEGKRQTLRVWTGMPKKWKLVDFLDRSGIAQGDVFRRRR